MPSWRAHGQLYLSCGAEIDELANLIGYWMDDSGIFIHPFVIINKDKKWLFTIKIFILYIYIYIHTYIYIHIYTYTPKLLRKINAILSVLNRKRPHFY